MIRKKILEATRQKLHIICRGTSIQITVGFSLEIRRPLGCDTIVFRAKRKKRISCEFYIFRNHYSGIKGKTFSRERKVKEFVTSKPPVKN